MDKKYLNLIAAAQKRRDELQKELGPFRREWNRANDEHQALQRERSALQERIKRFEADELDMSDTEFLDAENRIRLLTVRSRRAGDAYAKAAEELSKAESAARSELSRLYGEAIQEFDRDKREAREELDKTMRGLAV